MQRIGRFVLGRHGAGLLATTVALLAIASVAQAATITVTSTTDATLPAPGTQTTCPATCSLREAIEVADNSAPASTTITLPAGAYKLTIPATSANNPANGDLDVTAGATVTLNGAGSASTTIDANGLDRAFAVQQTGALTLSGLAIVQGNPSPSSSGASNGGAIYSDGALTITGDVVLRNDQSPAGGGAIFADTLSTLSVTGATFVRDQAANGGAIDDESPQNHASISGSAFNSDSAFTGTGGAVFASSGASGSLVINSSSFSQDAASGAAGAGGAIGWQAGNFLTVVGSTFTGNSATLGGAIYLSGAGGPLGLSQDEFDGNGARADGGAVYWSGAGQMMSSASSFIGNFAQRGAAIFANQGASLSSVNDTLSANSAVQGGGLFVATSIPATITNDTIALNASGGGIFQASDLTTGALGKGISNTIIADNQGGDCATTAPPAGFSASFDIGHNLDSDATCLPAPLAPGDRPAVNPLLSQPANNGGSVQTDAEQPGSPAIGAGSGTTCPANDARGLPRSAGTGCDIGAFEFIAGAPLFSETGPPAAVAVNTPFDFTIKLTETGAGPLTGTTVTDQLPTGVTFWGATASQGSCSSTASAPVKVTCALGLVNPPVGSAPPVTVTLVVSIDAAGQVSDTAAMTDDQGDHRSASASASAFATMPLGAAPSAQIGRASASGRHSATLLGAINPGGEVTHYFFQFGLTRTYGAVSAIAPLTPATTPGPPFMPVTAVVSGLTQGHRYHYRLVAINDSGVALSADNSFMFGHRKRRRHHRH